MKNSRSLVPVSVMLTIVLALALSPQTVEAADGPLCYVDKDRTAPGNGNAWATAYTDLQSALTDSNCTEIWVADGTYTPGTTRASTFEVNPGLQVYGGFNGTEESWSERDSRTNVTTLSGEIGTAAATDNAYHVVTMDGTGATVIGNSTVLDGFTIRDGYADGSTTPYDVGGGLFCDGHGNGSQCSPTLAHLKFVSNYALNGGGLYNDGTDTGASSPQMWDVEFVSNSANLDGGAMYNAAYSAGDSFPVMWRVSFVDNSAGSDGGAMFNDGFSAGGSHPFLYNATFVLNTASGFGGAIANYGYAGAAGVHLRNATFLENDADTGGAMWSDGSAGGSSTSSLINVIMWWDYAVSSADEIYNSAATPTISYSVVAGSNGSGASWNTSLGTDNGHNIDLDPKLGEWDISGETVTVQLLPGSSAIDTGSDSDCAAAYVSGIDQRGVSRPRGAHCDIGAYEATWQPTAADFTGDGTSDIVVYRGGAWLFHDFDTAAYIGGVWTGNPGACIPAPMDYDGDGAKEFTQLCGAAWHFYDDDGSYLKGIWIGLPGAEPVPADYDGDGTDEVVVFDNGAWQFFDFATGAYQPGSSVWTGNPSWGLVAGRAAPMDYDGDGTADFTVFSGGPWNFFNDDGTYNKGIWTGGVLGDVAVPGDYNGDGMEEVVVFRGGAWLVYDFTTGAWLPGSSVWTGAPAADGNGVVGPAPLDYNGDGLLDFTYYAGGAWHFYDADGTYNKGIWTGGEIGDQSISRGQPPLPG